MSGELIIYERNTLYDEIWAEPMRDVAARYGVSGGALAKTCRRLGVPVPGRGYWARVAAGKAPDRPPLPEFAAGERDRIVVRRREPALTPEPLAGLEGAAPLTLSTPILVPETLERPHRLVALSARYLRKAHPVHGIVSAPMRSCLDIAVSPDSLDRALRIFDALIKAMEATGLTVEVAPVGETPPAPRPTYYSPQPEAEPRPPQRVTRMLCDEEWIEFGLTETVRRIEDGELAPAEGSRSRQLRAYRYEPTGRLTLRLTNVTAPGVRTKWQETKQQRLEGILAEFVAYLTTAALSFKLEREAQERRAVAEREAEQRRYEEQLRRWEEEERRREEAKRREAFEAEVARWQRAQAIREYARVALAALEQRGLAEEDERKERDRLAWALGLAEHIDPLR